MKSTHSILAIESATDEFSVSLYKDGEIEMIASTEFRSASEKCAVYVQSLLNQTKTKPAEIDFFCVNKGPGSFTGLRVGLSFAQGFAFPHKIPIIGLNAFEILFNIEDNAEYGIIESKRDEVYLSKRDLHIRKIRKTELVACIGKEHVVTNDMKDFDKFLSNSQLIEHKVNSNDLIKLLQSKQKKGEIMDEDQIQLLYLNTFTPK